MLRDRRVRADEREGEEDRARPRTRPPILDLQQAAGNQAVARMLKGPRGGPVLARTIAIQPAAYMAGLRVAATTITEAQLTGYVNMAVKDELAYLFPKADADTKLEWKGWVDVVKDSTKAMPDRVAALNSLVTALNRFEAELDERLPAHSTRYATTPAAKGYKHSGGPTWGTDEKMRSTFAPAFAAISDTLASVDPAEVVEDKRLKRGGDAEDMAKPLKQIPFDEALKLFPKPLMNLVFDARFQLETGGATIIDERTEDDRAHKRATQSEGGSLRAYHQDSAGVLPPNSYAKAKPETSWDISNRTKKGLPAPAADNVPAHARGLHDHYARTSTIGAGSSIKAGHDTPEGFAEYTGTGTNTEHNTKVVLDYMNKRVYVTLSHYQYWALIDVAGKPTHWQSTAQELTQAQIQLTKHLSKEGLPPTAATMMSPWVEVLSPS